MFEVHLCFYTGILCAFKIVDASVLKIQNTMKKKKVKDILNIINILVPE